MTAEILIMNRTGIALAADSAVTLGVEKIYTSADKLFLLAENAPVGIMVYGNADLNGIPWETIIKLYRKELKGKTFDNLEDYLNSFTKFLGSSLIFTNKQQSVFVKSLADSYYLFLRDDLLRMRLETELEGKGGKIEHEDIKVAISELVQDELKKTKEYPHLDKIPRKFFSLLKSKYHQIIETSIENIFGELPIEQGTRKEMIELMIDLLTRRRFGPYDSGVVIAGFGEKEHFPSMFELNIQGIAAGQPLYYLNRQEFIGEDSIAYIAPFAQREMVYTFMEGIDPDLRDLIIDSTLTLFNGIGDIVLEELLNDSPSVKEKINGKLRDKLSKVVNELITDWDSKRETEYSGPIMDVVASLPKDELGAMAESLVNLTKFKRRVSRQQETVGGPIDVAVITKGDGFIWIKRKHYFSPELNPRFLGKYSR